MADEDEIDILGDFSFNSCFAQNNQGIPSCSNREDTVHPQWLLDSTATNWYDNKQSKGGNFRAHELVPRKLLGNSTMNKYHSDVNSAWSQTEREVLVREMAKYGRNVRKISQSLITKTEEEIQALIDAEFGVNLESPSFGLEKTEEQGETPSAVQEEIVADNITEVLNKITTGSPTIPVRKKPIGKKTLNKPKRSLLKPDVLKETELVAINPAEILYEDDLVIGSTESIGNDLDTTDLVSKNILKYQKAKVGKKIGNHRRKHTTNEKKCRNLQKSPLGRQQKDSSLSDDSVKSPKLQIVLGSGLAVAVSEGEQVIKIEKKKDSEPESDIEIDVDSDNEGINAGLDRNCDSRNEKPPAEEPVAVPLRKFEPMPRRHKKINLGGGGGGGFTIMHTPAGDLVEVRAEPKRPRQPRHQPALLMPCRVYNAEKPAPYEVHVGVCALLLMDAHGHSSRAEVMGLLGGRWGREACLEVGLYRPAAAAAGATHCDMDPVAQAVAAGSVVAAGGAVCGWHHSHPAFPALPSARDLHTQAALQRALDSPARPFLGLVLSQHWPHGRAASHYRCIRVEDTSEKSDVPVGYQFSVKLIPDLTPDNLQAFVAELRELLDTQKSEHSVDMKVDVCPQAGISYLDKFISSASHHMHSAGYEDTDPIVKQLLHAIRDIFR